MRNLFAVSLIFICSNLMAQPLGNDLKVLVGSLDNGLRYYVREHKASKGFASVSLVVKAGSLHEEEDQKGACHLLKHMVFRGSKHFTDSEVFDFFADAGIDYKLDKYAETNYSTTIYKLDVPVGHIDQTLLLTSDLAGRATIDREHVEEEKAIIVDEIKTSTSNAFWRNSLLTWSKLFPKSRYIQRPILGPESVISKCSREKLLEFYRKWYRPDQMAVVVVGDINSSDVEELIERYFASLIQVEGKVQEPDDTIELGEKHQSLINRDSATSVVTINFSRIAKSKPIRVLDRAQIKDEVYAKLFEVVMDDHFKELSRRNPAPLIKLEQFVSQLGSNHECREIVATCNRYRVVGALRAVLVEYKKLMGKGVTRGEFSRAKQTLRAILENLKGVITAEDYSEQYIKHFVDGSSYPELQEIIDTSIKLVNELSNTEFILWMNKNLGGSPWNIVLNGPPTMNFSISEMQSEIAQIFVEENSLPNREDKTAFQSAVKEDGMMLELAHDKLKQDYDIVLSAVGQNGLALKHAHPQYRKNRKIVFTAVKQNPLALEYVDESYKQIRMLVKDALRRNGLALKFVSNKFKQDRLMVLVAIKQNGLALEFADPKFKRDYDIALAAVKQNPQAITYVDESIKKFLKLN